MLTAQVNGTARVWEIATAQLVGPPIKSAGGGFAQLSPDGRRPVVRNLGVPLPAQKDVGRAQATCSAQVWNVD